MGVEAVLATVLNAEKPHSKAQVTQHGVSVGRALTRRPAPTCGRCGLRACWISGTQAETSQPIKPKPVARKTSERRLQKLEAEAAQLREELKNRDE
jgi:hypothetical protein